MRRYCEVQGKEIFTTRGEAERAEKRLNKRHKTTGAVYQCPHCHGWHITHYAYRHVKNFRTSMKKRGTNK